MWEELPEELWRRSLERGVKSATLSFKDLCCLSISSKRLHRLSSENSLWSSLLSSDFPLHSSSSSSSSKSVYRSRYEKDKARRVAAHKRAELRIESRIFQISNSLQELKARRNQESAKLKATAFELSNLHKVRQASVAINVWQPEVIRGRQKQIVEQCAVPVDSRINALEMELKLCKQNAVMFENAYRNEKQRLEEAKEQLKAIKYNPLRDFPVVEKRVGDPNVKKNKLKRPIIEDDEQCLEIRRNNRKNATSS